MKKFLKISLLAMSVSIPTIGAAWEVLTQKEDSKVFTIAEKIGDAGSFLNLVCFEKKIHIEVIYPFASETLGDAVELVQVDHHPEQLLAGFVEKIDRKTSVFVGVDRRDEPAAATQKLLRQIAAGNDLYLGDPDRSEAVEHWSLSGSRRAIGEIKKSCK